MAKTYFTDTIKIIEAPKYLPIEKIQYQIIFSKDYPTITSNLKKDGTINSFSVQSLDINATLSLKVEGIEIKKMRISIHEQPQTVEVSLKSTVSKTCEEPNTQCNFDLAVKIYRIDRTTQQAVLLSLSEIEKLAPKKKGDCLIHRLSGSLSVTGKTTIDLINNPASIQNKYVKKAVEIFKQKCRQYHTFPELIYREIMVELFSSFLNKSRNPDLIVFEIGKTFGVNVKECYTKEILVFYHIYEALIRDNDDAPGFDKIQHFIYSAMVQYFTNELVTDIAQYGGEAVDFFKKGSAILQDSLEDMHANNLGQAYGWELYKKHHPLRALARPFTRKLR